MKHQINNKVQFKYLKLQDMGQQIHNCNIENNDIANQVKLHVTAINNNGVATGSVHAYDSGSHSQFTDDCKPFSFIWKSDTFNILAFQSNDSCDIQSMNASSISDDDTVVGNLVCMLPIIPKYPTILNISTWKTWLYKNNHYKDIDDLSNFRAKYISISPNAHYVITKGLEHFNNEEDILKLSKMISKHPVDFLTANKFLSPEEYHIVQIESEVVNTEIIATENKIAQISNNGVIVKYNTNEDTYYFCNIKQLINTGEPICHKIKNSYGNSTDSTLIGTYDDNGNLLVDDIKLSVNNGKYIYVQSNSSVLQVDTTDANTFDGIPLDQLYGYSIYDNITEQGAVLTSYKNQNYIYLGSDRKLYSFEKILQKLHKLDENFKIKNTDIIDSVNQKENANSFGDAEKIVTPKGLHSIIVSPNGKYLILQLWQNKDKILAVRIYFQQGIEKFLLDNISPEPDIPQNQTVDSIDKYKSDYIFDEQHDEFKKHRDDNSFFSIDLLKRNLVTKYGKLSAITDSDGYNPRIIFNNKEIMKDILSRDIAISEVFTLGQDIMVILAIANGGVAWSNCYLLDIKPNKTTTVKLIPNGWDHLSFSKNCFIVKTADKRPYADLGDYILYYYCVNNNQSKYDDTTFAKSDDYYKQKFSKYSAKQIYDIAISDQVEKCNRENNKLYNDKAYNECIMFATKGIDGSHANSYGCKYCFMFSSIQNNIQDKYTKILHNLCITENKDSYRCAAEDNINFVME